MKYLLLQVVLLSVCLLCGCGRQLGNIHDTEKNTQEAFSESVTSEAEPVGNLSEGYYVYPDTSNMKAEQICEACRIPEVELVVMSSEQLAQAVADYPLLWEIETSSGMEYDMEWLAEKSDAYRELLDRKDARNALIEKCRELEKDPDNAVTVELLKKVILHEKAFRNGLSDSEKEYLDF